MASKNRFAAGQRKIKLHNNATSKQPLRCQVPHCEEDFYVKHKSQATQNKWMRHCFPHFEQNLNPPQERRNKKRAKTSTRDLLTVLKLI